VQKKHVKREIKMPRVHGEVYQLSNAINHPKPDGIGPNTGLLDCIFPPQPTLLMPRSRRNIYRKK